MLAESDPVPGKPVLEKLADGIIEDEFINGGRMDDTEGIPPPVCEMPVPVATMLLEMKIEDELIRMEEALAATDEDPTTIEDKLNSIDEELIGRVDDPTNPDEELTIADDDLARLEDDKPGTGEDAGPTEEDDRGISEEEVGVDGEPLPQV